MGVNAVGGLVGNGSVFLFRCVKIHPAAYREYIAKHREGEMKRWKEKNGEKWRAKQIYFGSCIM